MDTLGIGICGYPKAGKTRAARILESHYGADVLAVETIWNADDDLPAEIGDTLRSHLDDRLGSTLITLSVWTQRDNDRLLTIIDSVVSPEEADAYEDAFDTFILLYIDKVDEFRFEYYPASGETRDERWAAFKAADEKVADEGLEQLVADEQYDKRVGNDLESNFAEKVINATDGLVHRATSD